MPPKFASRNWGIQTPHHHRGPLDGWPRRKDIPLRYTRRFCATNSAAPLRPRPPARSPGQDKPQLPIIQASKATVSAADSAYEHNADGAPARLRRRVDVGEPKWSWTGAIPFCCFFFSSDAQTLTRTPSSKQSLSEQNIFSPSYENGGKTPHQFWLPFVGQLASFPWAFLFPLLQVFLTHPLGPDFD